MGAKPKVFVLSSTPPLPTWGGAMAFYRHFVDRSDFEIFVATDEPQVSNYSASYPSLVFKPTRLVGRLCRTRLSAWAHSYQHLCAGRHIPPGVLQAAQKFSPDLVFTVAGSW